MSKTFFFINNGIVYCRHKIFQMMEPLMYNLLEILNKWFFLRIHVILCILRLYTTLICRMSTNTKHDTSYNL